jgi:AhpD family alkylhydroperoxidase
VNQQIGTRVPIDKQCRRVYLAQINVAKAARHSAQAAGLSRALVELINIRISQINGCAYCLDIHVSDALRHGETTQRIAVLPAWRDTTLFTAKERAALVLAESVTNLPDARTREQDYADASEHLGADELAAVSWIAITMNAFNRISIVSRHAVRPFAETSLDGRPRTQEGPT